MNYIVGDTYKNTIILQTPSSSTTSNIREDVFPTTRADAVIMPEITEEGMRFQNTETVADVIADISSRVTYGQANNTGKYKKIGLMVNIT